ncbi:MAG: hypothetical protein QOI38_2661, partial [Sphingomonadales bacterium]|nr:hypothetical protein [Sphingomonadales bacterium]
MPWTLKFWNSSVTPPEVPVTWDYGAGPVPSDVPSSQATDITNHILSITSIFPSVTNKLDAYGEFRIGYRSGDVGSTNLGAPEPYTLIDLDAANEFYFFNTFGELVRSDIRLTIMHELAHAYLNIGDPIRDAPEALMNIANYNFRGPVVDEQNLIAAGAHLTHQIQTSYYAAFGRGDLRYDLFVTNDSYSEGNPIDLTRLGTALSDNIDHSNNTIWPRDLIFGIAGDDTIKSGTGNDYVYGGDGEDEIWGGAGDDLLKGEDGDDHILGEGGDDRIVGGKGDDQIWGGLSGVEAPGEEDVADYSQAHRGIRIMFDGSGGTPALTVRDGEGETDTLHSIEKIVGSAHADRLEVRGIIPSGFSVEIDAGTDPGDSAVIASRSATMIHLSILDDQGNGTLTTPDGGTITLKNFRTTIVGSAFGDVLF